MKRSSNNSSLIFAQTFAAVIAVLMLLTLVVPAANATGSVTFAVKTAYLPTNAEYSASNFQAISGVTVSVYTQNNRLLYASTVTDANGMAYFNLPANMYVYFNVRKEGYTNDFAAQQRGYWAYDTQYTDSAKSFDFFLKPTTSNPMQTLTRVAQETTRTDTNTNAGAVQTLDYRFEDFSVYVYNSNNQRVANALIGVYRQSDDKYVSGKYTDSQGKAIFYYANLPRETAFYFKATKEGKTYESIDGARFAKVADTSKEICQYTNTNQERRCNVNSYALTKEITGTSTNPVPSTNPRDGYFTVNVGTESSNKVPYARVSMYKLSDDSLWDSFTADGNGEVKISYSQFPRNTEIYFKAEKEGYSYRASSPNSDYVVKYDSSQAKFCYYWKLYRNINCEVNTNVWLQTKTQINQAPTPSDPQVKLIVKVFPYGATGANSPGVANAYVSMRKVSTGETIRRFYTNSNGEATFYNYHFVSSNNVQLSAYDQVYFTAEKDGRTFSTYYSSGDKYTYTSENGRICTYYNSRSQGCYTNPNAELAETTRDGPTSSSSALIIKAVDSKGYAGKDADVYVFDFNPVNGGRYLKRGLTGSDGKFYYYDAPSDRQLWIYAVRNDGSTNSCYSFQSARYCQAMQVNAGTREVTLNQADGTCYKDANGNCYRTPEAARGETNVSAVVDNVLPPMPPEEISSLSDVTIKLLKGWNLVSNPYGKLQLESTTCQLPVKTFWYSSIANRYWDRTLNRASVLVEDAYWMKAQSECSLNFKVASKKPIETLYGVELRKGWNLVGAPLEGETFDSGSCAVSSGPWTYANGQWQKADFLESGKAYFIKAKDSCNLGAKVVPFSS